MKGKPQVAQELTVRLLRMLDPVQREGAYLYARCGLGDNQPAIGQLERCLLFAGELDEDPSRYHNDFLALARTILARQKIDTQDREITKKQIWAAMHTGENVNLNSANNILDRIHDHLRPLSTEEIQNLLGNFPQESDRIFWENQLYLMFPDLPREDAEDGPVLDCLQAVWESLNSEEQATAAGLFLAQSDWLEQMQQFPSPKEEPESKGVYDLLDRFMKNKKIKVTEVCNALEIDPDTYYAYKKAWCSFENKGCKGKYPRNHLSRERLIFLAVFLDMDYYAAVTMLSMAGYSFQFTESDTRAAGYLLDKRSTTLEQAVKGLHPHEK